MSDLDGLRELRASLSRAQRELETAHERLESLERRDDPSATVMTPRAIDKQRRSLIAVGVFSSLGTAVLIGLLFAVGGFTRETPAPVVATAPPKVDEPRGREIPPPPSIVAEPAPAPVPVIERTPVVAPEPPRPPVRVARVNPYDPLSTPPARAREPETPAMGALTIICLPQKCDQITDNGVALGAGHIMNRPVPTGPHAITLHNANGESKTVRVDIQAERLKELRVNLHPDLSDVF